MPRVLGLDVSTSCTGICILEKDDFSVVTVCHEAFKGCDDIWQKADRMRDVLRDLHAQHQPDVVFVEQSLQSFMPGRSSAHTLLMLAKFNGLVSYFARELFKKNPEYVPVATARKTCGIKIMRTSKCGLTAKQQTFDHVRRELLPSYEASLTLKGNVHAWCYDEIDAYVIARAGCILSA